MTVWGLTKAGEYEAACRLADQAISQDNSELAMRNKMKALLSLRRYGQVVELSEKIIDLTGGSSSSDYLLRGVAFWFLDRPEEAIASWRLALKTPYTDAAGGVQAPLLLFYASVRCEMPELRKEAERLLKNFARKKASVNWPGPLAPYVLGTISEDDLLAALSSNPILRERQTCQAAFYSAVVSLAKDGGSQFWNHLREAVTGDPVRRLECEFFMANGELSNSMETSGLKGNSEFSLGCLT